MTETKFDIPENELVFSFIRADGPGGQNVNKVATAVQLRFDLRNTRGLPDDVKTRLVRMAGKRMTEDGVLLIEARRYREQERNRQDALARLQHLIEKAAVPPVKRVSTRPTAGSIQARLEDKKRRGATKQRRKVTKEELE
jgi:ribosome-associated protein